MRHLETVPGAAQCVFGGTHRPAVLHIAAWPPDYALDLEPVVPPAVPETRIARHRMRRGHVCTICDTPWPSRSWGSATARAQAPSAGWRPCPPIWDTPLPTTRT